MNKCKCKCRQLEPQFDYSTNGIHFLINIASLMVGEEIPPFYVKTFESREKSYI